MCGGDLRKHIKRKHDGDITEIELERYLVELRYPGLDLDALVKRYEDRLESVITLNRKGYYMKKYLQVIGVLRHPRSDNILLRILNNPEVKTAEDVRAEMERLLVGKFRNASPEVRFQGYLNRENSILEKKGQADLIPAISTLKTIKFVQKQLQEAVAAEKEDGEE